MTDYTFDVKKVDSTKREIKVSIKYSEFETEKKKQLKKMGKNVKLPGFRPGKAPTDMLEGVLGSKLIENTIEELLSNVTQEIIDKEKLSPVSRVKYDLKEVDKDKDLEYTASFHNFPEFKIPDFSKLKVKEENDDVTEKEIEEVLIQYYKDVEKPKSDVKVEAKDVTDEWVKKQKLGEASNLEDLKGIIKSNLEHQKIHNAEDKLVNDLIDEALKKTKIDVPEEFIDGEVKMRELQDKQRIESLGLKWDDWLKQQKKDMDSLKKEWSEEALNLYKRDFLTIAIANENDLSVKSNEIEMMMQIYTQNQNMSAEEKENLRMQLINNMTRRKAFDWIVRQYKGEKAHTHSDDKK